MFGRLRDKEDLFPHVCSYCRVMTGKQVFYFEKQPRLYFHSRQCADKWLQTFADHHGNLTWPGIKPESKTAKTIKNKVAWIKRIFRGDPS